VTLRTINFLNEPRKVSPGPHIFSSLVTPSFSCFLHGCIWITRTNADSEDLTGRHFQWKLEWFCFLTWMPSPTELTPSVLTFKVFWERFHTPLNSCITPTQEMSFLDIPTTALAFQQPLEEVTPSFLFL
jgi:hypothetical protein